MGDFSRELLARLEAAQLNSPAASHPRPHSGGSSSGGSLAPVGGDLGGARRALWPGELSLAGSLGSLGGSSGSPASSGCPTPRSAGLLEALLTSDGSPRADATAAAAAAAARAATAPLHLVAGERGEEKCWCELPADVWRWVALSLSPADVKSARLVCADWHAALSSNVQLLRPRQLRCTLAAARCGMGAVGARCERVRAEGCCLQHRASCCPSWNHSAPPCPQLPLPASPGAEPVPAAAGGAADVSAPCKPAHCCCCRRSLLLLHAVLCHC